jgi:hypothetical protein
LFINGFFRAKKLIQAARFDLRQQSSSNIHVSIQRRLSSSQLGQLRYGSLQMSSVRRQVSVTRYNINT